LFLTFETSTKEDKLSKVDEEAIEKWMNKHKIALEQNRRNILAQAQDLKYQVLTRIAMEKGMHALLQKVIDEMHAASLAREAEAGAEAANESLEDDAASADTQPDTLLQKVVDEKHAASLAREVEAGAEAANGNLEDDAASADTQPDTPQTPQM
jgi:hypothetical protein